MQNFRFEHSREEGQYSMFVTNGFPRGTSHTKVVTYDGSIQWPQVLDEFLDFLSGIYGNDIKSNVRVKDSREILATYQAEL